VVSDKRAKESQILPFGFESHREMMLHPVSIIVQIFNIIIIYGFYEKFTPYSGLKIALAFTFLQLLCLSYIYLHKPDEEA